MSQARRLVLLVPVLLTACTPTAPETKPAATTPPVEKPVAVETPAPKATPVALVEPYLVAVAPQKLILPPPVLGGRIMPLPSRPLIPSAPTETVPITPPPTTAVPATPAKPAAPTAKSPIPAMVRLLQEERDRNVDFLRRRLEAATSRTSQTAGDAKKTADLVRAGALAQFKSTQADQAAKDAAAEQADIQRALDEAIRRQGATRQDVETALRTVASVAQPWGLIQLEKPLPAYRPMDFTYRLTLIGSSETPTVTGGTLGRKLPLENGESAAWIIRSADPTQLQIKIGSQTVTPILRHLPAPDPSPLETLTHPNNRRA